MGGKLNVEKLLTLAECLDYFNLRKMLQSKSNKNNPVEPAMEV